MPRYSPLAALVLSISMLGSIVVAAPPSSAGSQGRSAQLRGSERRALNSRQQLFDRAAASQNRVTPQRPTAARPAGVVPGSSGPETAQSAQTLGRGPSNRPSNPGRSGDNTGASQSGTGILRRDILPSMRRQTRPTLPERATARSLNSNDRRQNVADFGRSRRADGFANRETRGQRPLQPQADRVLANRLAEIDRLRDVALERGSDRLLEQADRQEQMAREQFRLQTANRPLGRESSESGVLNADFGRTTADAAIEGRQQFGRDMAAEGQSRRPEITRGSSPNGETGSRRSFGESIRDGLRRIGSALRLPGQNRRTSE